MAGQYNTDDNHRHDVGKDRQQADHFLRHAVSEQMIKPDRTDQDSDPPVEFVSRNDGGDNQDGSHDVSLCFFKRHFLRKENMSSRRKNRKRHNDRSHKCEGFGKGQRFKKFPFGSRHREDRQKTHHRRGNSSQDRPADLGRRGINNVQRIIIRSGLIEAIENVLANDNTHIHHRADSNRYTRQRHNIRIDPAGLHRDKAHQHRQRKKTADECRTSKMHEQDDND